MPFLELDAADLREEIEVPIVASQLAVGDAFKAGVLLQLYHLADAFVLDLAQPLRGDVLACRCMRACCNLAGRSRLPT